MKYWILLFFFLAHGGLHPARASGIFNPVNSVIQLPPNIVISGNIPVGTVLWTSNEISSLLTATGTASDLLNAVIGSRLSGSSPVNNNASATSLPGVGVQWIGTWRAPDFPGGVTEFIPTGGSIIQTRPSFYTATSRFSQTMRLQLVKTGVIRSGTLFVSSQAETEFLCAPSTSACRWYVTASSSSSNVRVTTPVCSASTTNIGVPMPFFFPSPSQPTSPAMPFRIVLTCQGGEANSATRPLVRLTDANNRANTSSILSLTQVANAATGIGIQILRNNQPLPLGPENSAAAQWEAGTVNQGTSVFEIPLAARYVTTGDTVTTGIANGRAIFTLDYR